MKDRGISPFQNDHFLYTSKNLILVVCVDYVLILSPTKIWIDLFIKFLMDVSVNFEVTHEVNVDKHLGVEIVKHLDGTCELKYP